MTQPSRSRARRWEHLGLLTTIAGWIAWFTQDSWRVSASVENLLLIVPAAALALALTAFLAMRTLARAWTPEDATFASLGEEGRTLVFIVLFAAFIAGLAYAWFDVATFVFVAGSLLLLGERNLIAALSYAAGFALLVTYALREMAPYPFDGLLV